MRPRVLQNVNPAMRQRYVYQAQLVRLHDVQYLTCEIAAVCAEFADPTALGEAAQQLNAVGNQSRTIELRLWDLGGRRRRCLQGEPGEAGHRF